MKILSFSDVVEPVLKSRFDTSPFKAVDLALACGDIPPEYMSNIATRLNIPVYYVCGNHDIRHPYPSLAGCVDIHQRLVRFGGLKILGFEGSRWYNGGPHQYRELQMRGMIYRMLPRMWLRGRPDIIISHAPPRHVHDQEDPCHRGFKSFVWLIQKCRPRYFIHGHIHRHFDDALQRMSTVNGTTVVNTYGHYIIDI